MLAIGQRAPDFRNLPGVDRERYSRASFADKPVLVLIFTYNGCPTVKAEEERMIAIQEAYAHRGVQLVAINSNNAYLSPADTFPEMIQRAQDKRFNFPYLKDEDGSVADAFGAISTPHIFVLDSGRRLRYKGRIDDSRDPAKASYSDLENALEDVLAQRKVRVPETKPFGCAIVR
jgi:peroxiredoxin